MSWSDALGVKAAPAAVASKAPVSSGWAAALKVTPGTAPAAPQGIVQPQNSLQQTLNTFSPGGTSTKTTTPSTNTGADTKDILAGIAQGFARDAAQVGISIGNIAKPSTIGSSVPTSDFKIGGVDVGSSLFGKEPLGGLADTAARYEATLQKVGLGKASTPLAVLGSVLPPALDVTGFGIGEKAVARAGVKAAEEAAPHVVTGINTELPRHLLVNGNSAETKIPFANDYREHAPIETGSVPKDASGLPTIQTLAKPKKSEFTYEPIKAPEAAVETAPKASAMPPEAPIRSVEAPTVAKTPGVAKAASDINLEAVRKGFAELPEKDLAKYTPITKADQLEKVGSLLSDYEKAKSMAITGEGIPEGVKSQVLFNAVKNKALNEGDFQTLKELAKSPLASERSLHAQELGAAGFNNEMHDPVQAMREIAQVRSGVTVKRTSASLTRAVSQVKTEKAKLNNPKLWSDFVKQITC